jgi:hypothetical protein
MIIDIPALHGVEYVYGLFVNNVVHDFKEIAVAVETQKQMFVRIIVPYIVIEDINDGVLNIGFGNTMFKGGRIEFNGNFHIFNYTAFFPQGEVMGPLPQGAGVYFFITSR